MRLRPTLALPALLLLALPAAPARAQPQVNRCTGPDGQTVFSDRRCEDLGSVARMPPAALRDGETGLYRYGCPRRLSELVGLLRSAIEAHDVNRLSSLYLWGELSDPGANRVLTELEAISERTLVDIAPVYPDQDEPEPILAVAGEVPASAAQSQDSGAADAVAAAGTRVVARPRPRGLRLEQVLANGSTPSRTVLRLRRQYNCFWISL